MAGIWTWQRVPTIIGDLNGDGRITSADATLLASYLVNGSTKIVLEAAKITCNNDEISLADLILLRRILVGITTFCTPEECININIC